MGTEETVLYAVKKKLGETLREGSFVINKIN
jgi:hypothetical protein